MWDPRDPHVLLVVRRHDRGPLLAAANVSDSVRRVTADVLAWLGLSPDDLVDRLSGLPPQMRDGDVLLPPYAAAWLTARDPDTASAASAQRTQHVQTVQR